MRISSNVGVANELVHLKPKKENSGLRHRVDGASRDTWGVVSVARINSERQTYKPVMMMLR
jgi:hypothetical protein